MSSGPWYVSAWLVTHERERLAMGALCLALLGAVYLTTPIVDQHRGFGSDGRFYGAMAGEEAFDQALARRAPYTWRVLTPAVAATLPLPVLTSFQVLAFSATLLSLLALYALLRTLRFAPPHAGLGVLLYAGVFWTVKFPFRTPAYIDAQTQLFLIVLLLLLVRDRRWLIIPTLSLAVLHKESLLAFVAVAYAHHWLDGTRAARPGPAYQVALLAVPLTVLLGIRAFITPTNDYTALSIVTDELGRLLTVDGASRLGAALFSGLGVLPVLLVYGAVPARRFLATQWVWGALLAVGAVLLLGGVDKSRLFLYALPAAVVVATHVIREITVNTSRARVVTWLVLALGIHFYIGNYLTPIAPFPDDLARMVPEHAVGDSYQPTLVVNLVLSAVFLAATPLLLGRRARGVRGSP